MGTELLRGEVKLWTTFLNWCVRAAKRVSGSTSAPSLTAGGGLDTEFSAEVVRIVSIEAHPNAERLEIATFALKATGQESSYRVVIQKGQYKPGDLAAYFSVDCVLPTAQPAFAFLLSRLDGAGKSHYRLKAARLRGVFSQGLLVDAPAGFEWGASVADHFGVTYYRSPEELAAGPTAPTAKPRPQPFPVYTVDSLKKMPHLFADGEPVLVTEKIHGTNFRFGWVPRKFLGFRVGWRFVVGSHRVIKSGYSKGHYYKEDVWNDAAEIYKLAERTRDYKGYTFYGELYGYTASGKAIQDLTYGATPEQGPQLRIFDVRDPHGQWVTPMERAWICADVELDQVPRLFEGPWHYGCAEFYADGPSRIHRPQIREGCVVEALEGSRRKAKYVGQEYLMRKAA